VDVLRQLTPTDAQVLQLLYRQVRWSERNALAWEAAPIPTGPIGNRLGLSDTQFALNIDTLIRLRLCAPPTPNPTQRDVAMASSIFGAPPRASTYQVCPTVFGREFLQACTPPGPVEPDEAPQWAVVEEK
jgi:hypothetical protein